MVENEKYQLNTYEPKIENNEKDIDEFVIKYYYGCCIAFILIFSSLIFLWFPFLPYWYLIHIPFKKVIVLDKKKKTIIIGDRGIFNCCCVYNKITYFLKDIKNAKILVSSRDDPKIGFSKLYFINGYIYSQNNECRTLFSDIAYTKEKYDKFVSVFKKYINTIDEPLEMAKNECNIEPIENNDYPSRLSIDEYPAMPIDKNF